MSERGVGVGGGTCFTWSTKDFTEGSSNALFSVANFSLDGDNATNAGYPYLHKQQEGLDDAAEFSCFVRLALRWICVNYVCILHGAS